MDPPPYLLEVEPLDLGADVKAVGLEFIERESREPVGRGDAGRTWGAVLAALAGAEPWGLDFFSHLDRVSDFCRARGIACREVASRCIVIPAPEAAPLAALLERFAGETFGARAGARFASGDAALEGDLSRRGVDAYHPVFPHYFFCAVCDFENGFLTLLTTRLWTSEVMRRVRPALEEMSVEVARAE